MLRWMLPSAVLLALILAAALFAAPLAVPSRPLTVDYTVNGIRVDADGASRQVDVEVYEALTSCSAGRASPPARSWR